MVSGDWPLKFNSQGIASLTGTNPMGMRSGDGNCKDVNTDSQYVPGDLLVLVRLTNQLGSKEVLKRNPKKRCHQSECERIS